MVRLEGATGGPTITPFEISIPLWFDWKLHVFYIGYRGFNYFNSTMVRLEVNSWSKNKAC